jgi:hypothetical protein
VLVVFLLRLVQTNKSEAFSDCRCYRGSADDDGFAICFARTIHFLLVLDGVDRRMVDTSLPNAPEQVREFLLLLLAFRLPVTGKETPGPSRCNGS